MGGGSSTRKRVSPDSARAQAYAALPPSTTAAPASPPSTAAAPPPAGEPPARGNSAGSSAQPLPPLSETSRELKILLTPEVPKNAGLTEPLEVTLLEHMLTPRPSVPVLSDESFQDVVGALKKARLPTLRNRGRKPPAALQDCPLVTLAMGSEVKDKHIWHTGTHLVVSGGAAVAVVVDNQVVVVARLKQGDSFGWSWSEHDVKEFIWAQQAPCIIVDADADLVLCQLRDSISCPHKAQISPRRTHVAATPQGLNMDLHLGEKANNHCHMAEAADALGGLSADLATLWLQTTVTPQGVCSMGGLFQAHFFHACWGPLLDRLEAHEDEIRRRKRRGFRIHDCFPLQGHQVDELKFDVKTLTTIWYGSERGGNFSAMFRWFMKAMDAMEVTAYLFDDIPTEPTPDKWAVIVDAAARGAALKAKAGVNQAFVAAGGLGQKQGKSAIDNTVLRNVFTPNEAREMFVGRKVRKVACKFLEFRQIIMLRKLSRRLQIDLVALADEGATGRGHRVVRSILRSLSKEDLEKAGINPDGICFRELKTRGACLAGFGQLEPNDQKLIWTKLRNFVFSKEDEIEAPEVLSPKADSEDIFECFVAFARDHPGEFFEGDKQRHLTVHFAGLFNGKIFMVRRSSMEKLTLARYFSCGWRRTQPLWGMSSAAPPVQVRPPNVRESSHVRANECPYAKFHGMSLSSGGFASDEGMGEEEQKRFKYSLLMEFQWIKDPSANIENWFLTDIEKILHEAWQLNPRRSKNLMLPGEIFVHVGQNPKIGSSIKSTQHTQLCEGSLSKYCVLQLASSQGPRFSKELDASLDLVDIGPRYLEPELCGFFLRIVTERPTAPPLVGFLVELRLALLRTLGGSQVIDFMCSCMADEHGKFVILFAPLPQLEKITDEAPDFASFANPLTGESSETAGLEETRIDFGKAVGHFLCAKAALREQLTNDAEDFVKRLWAFNRVPGAQEVVRKIIAERRIFEGS